MRFKFSVRYLSCIVIHCTRNLTSFFSFYSPQFSMLLSCIIARVDLEEDEHLIDYRASFVILRFRVH